MRSMTWIDGLADFSVTVFVLAGKC